METKFFFIIIVELFRKVQGLGDIENLVKDGKIINNDWRYIWENSKSFRLNKPPKGHHFEKIQEKRFVFI